MAKSTTTPTKTGDKPVAKSKVIGDALRLILKAKHHDPFSFLGLHNIDDAFIYRTFLPQASEVFINVKNKWVALEKTHPDGLYSLESKTALATPCLLKITVGEHNYETHDPYTFTSTLTQDELYLFGEARLMQAYKTLGAQCMTQDGVTGVRFAVWAPNAERVSVIGSFNNWDGRVHSCLLYTSRCV